MEARAHPPEARAFPYVSSTFVYSGGVSPISQLPASYMVCLVGSVIHRMG